MQDFELCKGVLEMSENNQPAFRVYSVISREGKDDYWLNIGLAFPHQDGKGFNVMLQALPLNAKLVLREAAEEESEQPSARVDRQKSHSVTRERRAVTSRA